MASALTDTDIAQVLDEAADHIATVGFFKKYLYNTRQAESGLPLGRCEVDVLGAINYAVHGTPRYAGGDPRVHAAEKALNALVNAPSVAAWCDYKGNGKARAIDLLRSAAASLRKEAA